MTTLFHYCSLETFQSIIENRSIRLSSLKLSNDTAEGKLVREIVSRLAKEDGLDGESIKHLESNLVFLEDLFEGMGFCLSKSGDLLSQWRGYAADGTGFSIGFNKKYFDQLSKQLKADNQSSYRLIKVHYKTAAQLKLVNPIYQQIKDLYKDGKLKYPRRLGLLDTRSEEDFEKEKTRYKQLNQALFLRILGLMPVLFSLKTEAFKEEQEWRLVTQLIQDDGDTCEYKSLSNRLVPFKTFKLTEFQTAPINEVIVGPKNITPINVIERLLKQNGFNNIKISRSASTYR